MTLDDLAGRLFASTREAAEILGTDPRTLRRMAAAGDIPSSRAGSYIKIPVAWLREEAGIGAAGPVQPEPVLDLDQLAERVADRVLARLARLFGQAPDVIAAGPAPPGPAAIATDPLPATERSRANHTRTA